MSNNLNIGDYVYCYGRFNHVAIITSISDNDHINIIYIKLVDKWLENQIPSKYFWSDTELTKLSEEELVLLRLEG